MTEEYIKKLAEDNYTEYCKGKCVDTYEGYQYIDGYTKGYEQGQKDFDTDVTKLLNSYGVKFIDTNSIGGLIALHQLILDLEKENEELKAQIEELKAIFEIVCKERYGYAWEMRKSDLIEKLKRRIEK